MDVLPEFAIVNKRDVSTYKIESNSGYKKQNVITSLMMSLKDGYVQKSCYWSAEMLSSNMIDIFLQKSIAFLSQEIYQYNPNAPKWLHNEISRINSVIDIFPNNLLELRNSQEVRNSVCEISTVLSMSRKRTYKIPKINDRDFDLDNIKRRLLKRNTNMISGIIKEQDPREIVIPLNELANHIMIARKNNHNSGLNTKNDSIEPFYWCSWILEWDKKLNSRNVEGYSFQCAQRQSRHYDFKFCRDCVWLLWELIIDLVDRLNINIISEQVKSLFLLYTYNFSKARKNERRFIFFHAIRYITDKINWDTPVHNNRTGAIHLSAGINFIYKNIQRDGLVWYEKNYLDNMNTDVDARKIKRVKAVKEEKITHKDLSGVFNEVSSIAVKSQVADDNDFNDIRNMLKSGSNIMERFKERQNLYDEPKIIQKPKQEIQKSIPIREKKPKSILKKSIKQEQEIKKETSNEVQKNVSMRITPRENMVCIPTIDGEDKYITRNEYEYSVSIKKQIIENSKISEMNADNITGIKEKTICIKGGNEINSMNADLIERKMIRKDEENVEYSNNDIDIEEDNFYVIEEDTIFDNSFWPNDTNEKSELKVSNTVNDCIKEEFIVNYSRSSHLVNFTYSEIDYKFLIKKYTKFQKTIIPAVINELKKLFGLYYLPMKRIILHDTERRKNFYYLLYKITNDEKLCQLNNADKIICRSKDILYDLIRVISFRYVIGTNDSSNNTILYSITNNKVLSYEESNLGMDNKVNLNIGLKSVISQKLEYFDDIFKKWNDYSKEDIKNCIKKYYPENMEMDVDLKVHFITYKIQNGLNKLKNEILSGN